MTETASEKRAKKPKTSKTESQRLAAHRAYCATSEDRKRDAGLERLTIWVPKILRGHFKALANDACASHLRQAGPQHAGPVAVAPIPESAQSAIPATKPATSARKARPGKAAKSDSRQLSLFETPAEPEGGADVAGG